MNLNSETILLTFGDSWTVGDGAGYIIGVIKLSELFHETIEDLLTLNISQ